MPDGYYRFPTIHFDTVVFVSEDDLWTVPVQGGIARRLTSNLGEVSRPLLSPDGKLLAFVGREEGQPDIYVMPALGGPARRLTYLGGSLCLTAAWTAGGDLIFANNAGHWYPRFTYLYKVDMEGNPPEILNYGMARSIAFGPNGGVVLGRNTDDPARWKRYRGGTAGQLWIDVSGENNFCPLLDLQGNLASPMWLATPDAPNGRIFFISDHEGVGNIYSCLPSGEDVRRHTDHGRFYVRNASSDGQRIVYHAGADLYVYDPANDRESTIAVDYHSPQTQRNRKFVSPSRYLEDWAIHPNGQSIAISARGKVFSFANWEGAVRQYGEGYYPSTPGLQANLNGNGAVTGIRYRLPQWLNNGKRLIAVTDEGGEESFVLWNADGSGEPEILNDLDIGRPEAVAVNPEKDQIVFSNHRYELMFLDLTTRELKRIDRGKANPIAGFDWSPDGEWVAYSVSTSLQVMVLKLWRAASGEIFPLTKPVFRDVAPAFDPGGRYLYFLSYRTFDPVYDNLQFDLGFPRGMHPYLIPLQKDLPSPFIPRPRGEEEEQEEIQPDEDQKNESRLEESEEAGSESGAAVDGEPDGETGPEQEAAEKEVEPEKIKIDLEGIDRRLVMFPSAEGIYGRILGVKSGKVVYSRFPIQGSLSEPLQETEPDTKGSLWSYNFDEQKEENLVSGITDFDISKDGASLIYRSGNRLRVIKAGEKPQEDGNAPNRKTGWLNLERAKVSVEPGAEWRQMFREAWRLQRDQFWTPDMAQIDWLAIHDRYLPLVDRVSSRSEFSDLMWEMQGELGTSHAYEMGGDYRPEPSYRQGMLGADFAYDPEANAWRIAHIYQGDVWDTHSDSPLNRPGIDVKEGDLLFAINGQKLDRTCPPARALINLAGNEVTLTVSRPGEIEPRMVTVKTLYSETQARYREWVEANREAVHRATGGRVGYVHIPDMMGAGFAEFHRGYLAEVDRDGLIVDVRFNRGGHVSALILEKLSRRRIGYDTSRWSEMPFPYPPESILGPIIALTNENAGSDGDIFSHGFKLMQLGPLVGKRTWGGVIGINPRHALVDGTLTTQPEFSFWFSDVGWGVENYGTDPDIEVDITPQDYVHGVDPQLDRAIQEIQQMLVSNPVELPKFLERPSRALPKLPKR